MKTTTVKVLPSLTQLIDLIDDMCAVDTRNSYNRYKKGFKKEKNPSQKKLIAIGFLCKSDGQLKANYVESVFQKAATYFEEHYC